MPSVRELQAELRAKGLGVNNGHNKNQLMDQLRAHERRIKTGAVEKKTGRKKARGPRRTRKEEAEEK